MLTAGLWWLPSDDGCGEGVRLGTSEAGGVSAPPTQTKRWEMGRRLGALPDIEAASGDRGKGQSLAMWSPWHR